MTGVSLWSESMKRAERAELALERVLALASVMDKSSSQPVRDAAASIRTVIAQPKDLL